MNTFIQKSLSLLETDENLQKSLLDESGYSTSKIEKRFFVKRFINNQFLNQALPVLNSSIPVDQKLELLETGVTNMSGSRGTKLKGFIQHHLNGTHTSTSPIAGVTIYMSLNDHTSIHNKAFVYLGKDPKINSAFDSFYKTYEAITASNRHDLADARGTFILETIVPFINANRSHIDDVYKKCLDEALSEVLFGGVGTVDSIIFTATGDAEQPDISVSLPNASSAVYPIYITVDLVFNKNEKGTIKLRRVGNQSSNKYKVEANQYGNIKDILNNSSRTIYTAKYYNSGNEVATSVEDKFVDGKDFAKVPVLKSVLPNASTETEEAYKELMKTVSNKFGEVALKALQKYGDTDTTANKLLKRFIKKFDTLDEYDLYNLLGVLEGDDLNRIGKAGNSFSFASDINAKTDKIKNEALIINQSTWYTNPDRCSGCENYTGSSCLYDLELEEQEDGVDPGTYTKAKKCPFFSA